MAAIIRELNLNKFVVNVRRRFFVVGLWDFFATF